MRTPEQLPYIKNPEHIRVARYLLRVAPLAMIGTVSLTQERPVVNMMQAPAMFKSGNERSKPELRALTVAERGSQYYKNSVWTGHATMKLLHPEVPYVLDMQGETSSVRPERVDAALDEFNYWRQGLGMEPCGHDYFYPHRREGSVLLQTIVSDPDPDSDPVAVLNSLGPNGQEGMSIGQLRLSDLQGFERDNPLLSGST